VSTHQFVVMWDNRGLEFVGDYTDYAQDQMWSTLQGKKSEKTFVNLMHLKLRAHYNTQRHYEIYIVAATEGITANDIRSMFENNPQTAADLIRDRGYCYYSDRVDTDQVKII
jgi:hypothetical protein